MRHRKKTVKLQRKKSHREALLKNLCKELIEHRRIRTTLAKAKAVRPLAEKLVSLGKRSLTVKGNNEQETSAAKVHLQRQAFAKLRNKDLVHKLFHEIAPASKDRPGGYTRITKLGQRRTDSAPMAFIEWVDAFVPAAEEPVVEAAEPVKKPKKAKAEASTEKKAPAKRASKKAAASKE